MLVLVTSGVMSGSEPLLRADRLVEAGSYETTDVEALSGVPLESPRRALVSAIATLTLAILGRRVDMLLHSIIEFKNLLDHLVTSSARLCVASYAIQSSYGS